jgi:hypothetical protein
MDFATESKEACSEFVSKTGLNDYQITILIWEVFGKLYFSLIFGVFRN